MLPTLRKHSACAWKNRTYSAGQAAVVGLALTTLLFLTIPASAQRNAIGGGGVTKKAAIPSVSVLTAHNNKERTGLNASETAFVTTLGSTNLSPQTFGKIWSRPVDGTIYTQPLYVPAVKFPNVPDVLGSTQTNGVYNAVFVCTTHNSVYAFDAGASAPITHTGSVSTAVRKLPLWRVNFNSINGDVTPVPLSDVFSDDLTPEIGITGTPVIDTTTDPVTGYKTGTLYVVVKTKENSSFAQRLHALDITTGAERPGSPVLITAGVLGTGDGSILDPNNGNRPTVFFDPQWENQQGALTLANGRIYVTWGSHGNNGPFHGWVMSFDAKTLRLTGALNTTRNADSGFNGFPAGGGVWLGGGGPAVDSSGYLYLATGTGVFDAVGFGGGNGDYAQSVLKVAFPSVGGSLIADSFTPNNWLDLSMNSLDLGSGGLVLLPPVGNLANPNLAVAAGTEGTIYLLNRNNLGGFTAGQDTVVQSLPGAVGPIFGQPAFWNNTLYYQGTGDVMKAFQFQTGLLNDTPISQSNTVFEFPGASPTVTTNPDGSNPIVWALQRFTPPSILPGFGIPEPAPLSVVRAYDANDLSRQLFSGLAKGTRDVSSSAVYTPMTVANGRAYIGGQGEIVAFGNFIDNGVVDPGAQADHYIITGPNQVSQKTGNWYSITAIGPDNNPVALNSTVHLSYRTFGGPTVNVNSINFGGKSNVLFNFAFPFSGVFEFYANDDFGHSTYVPDGDLLPFGTLYDEISVQRPDVGGPDHLIVKAPAQAKVGSRVSVQVTVVTPANVPYTWHINGANFFRPSVTATMTLPNGTQGAIPGFPVYAYSGGQTVPIDLETSMSTIMMTVPGVGNHVLVVEGSVNYLYGTDPANPTLVISYPISGTATIVGVP